MSLDLLKEHVKNRNISRLYLFYGPEEYLIRHYIKSVEDIVVDESTKGFNRMFLYGKADTARISSFIETYPVFAQKKLLVVNDSGLFKTGSKSEEMESLLDDIPDYMCVVFVEQEVDKRLKLYKVASKKGVAVEFPWQKPQDLAKWVINILKSNGKRMDIEAANYLVDINDYGMTGIYNEVNKIISFVQDSDVVTIDDIKRVGSVTVKSIIFNLTDSIVKRDLKASFKILDEILSLREPVPKVLVMIAWQLRQIYLVKLFTDSGESIKDAGTRLHIHPFTLSKIRDILHLYTVKQLEQSLLSVYECDRRIKTGKMKDRIALEVLLENLASI